MHDLVDNIARTLLVVFSIAVGVFSIGVIAGAYQIISNDMSASYAAEPARRTSNCAWTNFDDDMSLDPFENQRGMRRCRRRGGVFNMRVRVPGTEKWTTLDMVAFEDFENNAINLLTPDRGRRSVPAKREVLLEKDALEDLDVGVGDVLEFELPDGSTKTLPVVGIVQDTGHWRGRLPGLALRVHHPGYPAVPADNRSCTTACYVTVAEGRRRSAIHPRGGRRVEGQNREERADSSSARALPRRTGIRWPTRSTPSWASCWRWVF
ncbi:MAG: hypothetical protein MZV70_17885 [Desulfobacterales bacterium]|nr:hypothetical protein [Desulfobacterales bacterium]